MKFTTTVVLFICLVLFVNSEIVLPEFFSAELLIQSRQTSNLAYKAYFQKTENSVEVKSAEFGSSDQYIYFNGKMLKKTQKSSECLEQEDIPPFQNLSNLLKGLKRIETQTFDTEVNKCKNEKYSFNYAGEYFVLCLEKKLPKRIIGRNVLISIQNFNANRISKYFTASEAKKCPDFKKKINFPQEKVAWFNKQETCLISRISDSKECSMQKILTEPTKNCIFFHGSGETVTGPPIPQHPVYWGKIHEYTPHCKTRKFIREETKIRGWDSLDLQRKYCNYATEGQDDRKLIKNKIIITHSMGALILAGAIKNNICDVDTKTTTWYTMASSFSGTKIIPFVKDICEERNSGIIPSIKKFISEKLGYCMPGKKKLWPAYETLHPNNPKFEKLSQIAETRVNGSLCGTSPWGLFSEFSAALEIVAKIVDYGEPSDGLVPITSCKVVGHAQGKEFKDTPDSEFYRPATNHPDNTCRHGDGFWSERRRPCSWLLNKQ
eukprot:gene8277-102_t